MTAGLKQSHYKEHQDIVWKYWRQEGGKGVLSSKQGTEKKHRGDKTKPHFYLVQNTVMVTLIVIFNPGGSNYTLMSR